MPDVGTICPGLYDTEAPSRVDGPSWDIGRLSCLIYEVKRGSKPVAEIVVPVGRVGVVKDELDSSGLFYHMSPRGEFHTAVYLSAREHLLAIVRHMLGDTDAGDLFSTWVWGKIFGYSEEAIEGYFGDSLGTSLSNY